VIFLGGFVFLGGRRADRIIESFSISCLGHWARSSIFHLLKLIIHLFSSFAYKVVKQVYQLVY